MHKYKIYFAGPLFDIKDLTGNLQLAAQIEKQSESFECVLPQNLLFEDPSPKNIRNQDLKTLISSDLALFNFDGTELDSGTVAEFMTAKFLAIPAVVIRSDFRKSGDQDAGGENWNLMCSFYPQTESLAVNSIYDYHLNMRGKTAEEAIDALLKSAAINIVEAFGKLLDQPKVIKQEEAFDCYKNAIMRFGGELDAICDDAFLGHLIEQKTNKNLFL